MTIDYLVRTKTITLDANGNGTARLNPDTGEYWAINFARVSTVSRAKLIVYCALFQGAINTTDATTFVDETYLGNGDVSSVVSGTIVQRGEAITAQWTGGTPGDVAILSIYGRACNTLPEIASVLATIPGARFQGSNSAAITNIDTFYVNQKTFALGVGQAGTTGIFNTYGAAGMLITALNNDVSAVQITVYWYFQLPSGLFINSNEFQFIVPGGIGDPVRFIIPVISSRCEIIVSAPAAATANLTLFASSSHQQSGVPLAVADDNVLMERTAIAVGAGLTDTVTLNRTWVGNAQWVVDTNATTWECSLKYVDFTGTSHIFARFRRSAATPEAAMRVILPAAPLQFLFINTSAAGILYNAYLVGQPIDKDF